MARTETIEQWRADLHLLRAWAGSDERLAEILAAEVGTIRAWATQREPGYDKKQEIRDLRERWEDEHAQSAERHALVEQVLVELEQAEDWADIERIRERTRDILEKKDHALCEV